MNNAHKILVENITGKRLVGRPICTWEHIFKMDVHEVQYVVLAEAVNGHSVFIKGGEFLACLNNCQLIKCSASWSR
jgi:hypothetical protein